MRTVKQRAEEHDLEINDCLTPECTCRPKTYFLAGFDLAIEMLRSGEFANWYERRVPIQVTHWIHAMKDGNDMADWLEQQKEEEK